MKMQCSPSPVDGAVVDLFKLPLRQWLCHQVDSHKYDGLEWVDSSQIKIPWTQQHHPNWQRHYELFVAWARHRGTYEEPPDYKKLKGNFRCALRKSDDFEEVKEKSKMSQQMDNYKIFKLVSPQEVEMKRNKRKRQRSPVQPKGRRNSKKMMCSSLAGGSGPRLQSNGFNDPTQLEDVKDCSITRLLDSSSGDWCMDDLLSPSLMPVASPPPLVQLSEQNVLQVLEQQQQVEQQQQQQQQFSPGFAQQQQHTPPPPAYTASSPLQVNAPLHDPIHQPSKAYHDMLREFQISVSELSRFQLTIAYDGEQTLQRELDLTRGVRVLYGNASTQRTAVDLYARHAVAWRQYETLEMPSYYGANRHVRDVLDRSAQGVVVRFDGLHALQCTRFCQSAVHRATGDDGAPAMRLERDKPGEVFSYARLLQRLLRRPVPHVTLTGAADTELVIGTKPDRAKLVTIALRPVVAERLVRLGTGGLAGVSAPQSSLFDFSKQDSLDVILRDLDALTLHPSNATSAAAAAHLPLHPPAPHYSAPR